MLAPLIAGDDGVRVVRDHPARRPTVSMFGHRTPLQLTDLPVAVLLVLAVAGVGVYGIVLAGWSSGSTYPLLGGLRSTAQVISYEIAMGLVARRGVHLLRVDVDLGDRRRRRGASGSSCRRSSPSRSTSSPWSARPTACRSTSPRARASSPVASTPSTAR